MPPLVKGAAAAILLLAAAQGLAMAVSPEWYARALERLSGLRLFEIGRGSARAQWRTAGVVITLIALMLLASILAAPAATPAGGLVRPPAPPGRSAAVAPSWLWLPWAAICLLAAGRPAWVLGRVGYTPAARVLALRMARVVGMLGLALVLWVLLR